MLRQTKDIGISTQCLYSQCQARRNHYIYGRVPKHTTVADVVAYFSPESDLSCQGKDPGVASFGTVCNFGIQIYSVF